MLLIRIVLIPVILGCVVISALFAFEFGWSKGATEIHRWAFGLAGSGLDLLKAAMPIIGAAAFAARDRMKGLAAWFVFVLLTIMSLWCAYGTTASQLAERIGNKAVEINRQSEARATLERLKAERRSLPSFEIATDDSLKAAETGIRAAENAVEAADRAVTQECGKVGENCRKRQAEATDRRAELAKAIAAKTAMIRDKAATMKAEALDAQIRAAEAALASIDIKTVAIDPDPQAASMSKATGWSEQSIALFSHLLFAIGIEAGSGFGLWLIMGHGVGRRDDLEASDTEDEPEAETPNIPAPVPVDSAPVLGSRAHFFKECVMPDQSDRVSAAIMYRAYQGWCQRIGVEPVSAQVFGRDPPWQKEKIGGTVFYLNCKMAAGYDVGTGPLRVVANNG